MFEINITVNCPDLVNAATILANAMGSNSQPSRPKAATPVTMDVSGTTQPVQYGSVMPGAAPTAAPTNPASVNPTTGSPSMMAPMASSSPSNAVPVVGVPLAQAPAFTLEQVSKAGAELLSVQPAKMPELMGLLAQFGVQTVNALKPDQLGAFATALRGMGAQI